MHKEFSEWIKAIDFDKPPIVNHVNWSKGLESESYPLLLKKMKQILLPELAETTDFGGYNLSHLRQFYSLFYLVFHFIEFVEEVTDQKFGVDNSFGSNPLDLTFQQFVLLSSRITRLPLEILANIITDLTFNPESFHTSISIQPFVLSNSGTYFILPNLFSQLEPSRMFIGALNKGPKKRVYDNLINQIEKTSLKNLQSAIIIDGRWKCHIEKMLKFKGKQYQPDLIIIDEQTNCLCVVDYKHFIGPTTASEVVYRMAEMKKGIDQVNKYVEIVPKTQSLTVKDIENYQIFGLLLTQKAMPVPIPKNIETYITDTPSFTSAILNCQQNKAGLNSLINSLAKGDSNNINDDFTAFDAEVAVKDWRIIRTTFKRDL